MPTPQDTLDILRGIREQSGASSSPGLPDAVIERFAARDALLHQAVAEAGESSRRFRRELPHLVGLDETDQVREMQRGYLNFYPDDLVNPYVALAARGPWIVTSAGAVIHDSGGYGMLGFGHSPRAVLDAMGEPRVMANVMTASPSQPRLIRALEAEIGHRRAGACPFEHFVCLNSGSEAMTFASRLADIHAKQITDPGGSRDGASIRTLALEGGFHGRTSRPAQVSDSTACYYRDNLASFRGHNALTVPANDIGRLRHLYALADDEGWFIEAFYMEPVMGEGNPGKAVTREFYDTARALSRAHGSLLVVDSIQAGLRAHGCLSIVDYPGFEEADPPDVETYSKALNAGQYPLSVVAMTPRAAAMYRRGVYGNTMTTNPRALEVGVAVLSSLTGELRENIRARGVELVAKLERVASDLGGPITAVQGTGLLVSCAFEPAIRSHGSGSVEEEMRRHGVGVIHGGANSVRYTPHFAVTSAEIDLIVDATRSAVVSNLTPAGAEAYLPPR
ncbi:MAG: aminotransferase class III-fold pyridoxal phosphate-dependent enzyme [Gammaproteobacteria bacterium]|nr:aminotransferase class III-fold pyridoxal phosphate-dependent enzyme [Gammaproteobacteria bacterium]MDE0651637.1 aminotransferase class III-fold pyridoxal phosphate-dependent enzyme [Gammaproteobacteria bacterium]